MPNFVHLRAHTEYSFEDGLIRVGDLVQMAADDGQPAVAVTDLNRMFNTVNFYEEARGAGVKPIVGADLWIEPDVTVPTEDGVLPAPVRLLVITQNLEGYRRLMDWMSRAYLTNQRNGIAAIKQSWMRDEGTDGLIALSGDGATGEIPKALLDTSLPPAESAQKALNILNFYQEVFPDRFYLEVQRAGFAYENDYVARVVGMARHTGVPLVATHPIQFKERADFFAHEVKVSINAGEAVESVEHEVNFTREQHFKTQAEMEELFQDLPEALENAGEIARRCALDVPLRTNSLPQFETPNGETINEFFAAESRRGLEERLVKLYPDEARRDAERPRYEARIQMEIDTIIKMGFTGYFMIVSDFIRWAKDNDIPVGPGRGSGAGSLVAYSLKITDLDPLEYNLLFERFLNPERVSMPDFDIDFESERRGEVIRYVKDKYGEQAVSQIAAPGMFKAKAALRAVGKTLQVHALQVDTLAKLIPGGPKNQNITLDEAMKAEPKLQTAYDTDAQVKRLFDVAMRVEGSPSHVGTHAGGVLIAPGKLSDFTPLYLAEDGDGVISQYDKDQVEAAGLVKFDFLALNNLSIIQQAIKMINARPDREGNPLDIDALPLDDPKVYESFAQGNTVGVFQFESTGMQGMLRKSKPDRFEDLIALVALYRPGPMDLIPDFANRKAGAAFEYPDPRVEPVLKETYGVMVYQEQVMQMAQIVGGYSLGGADLLRRAMGKKKPEEMAKHRRIFADGAAKNGVGEEKANEIYDLMEKFAGYGFNKSHAAAYALLAYQTSYLKTHYPAEYLAAFMNVAGADNSKVDRVEILIKDAELNGVTVLPPDVNASNPLFVPVDGGRAIRYGLAALKGVNQAQVRSIQEARDKDGAFESFIDFCKKVGRSKVSPKTVEVLAKAGAFDTLNPDRASVFSSVAEGMKYASKLAKQVQESGPLLPELFGDLGAAPAKKTKAKTKKAVDTGPVPEPMMADVPKWTLREQLEHERGAVGFYLTGHPFDGYKQLLGGLRAALPLSVVDKIDPNPDSTYLVSGVLSRMRKHIITKPGKNQNRAMIFATIDDGLQEKDITLFPDLAEQVGDQLKLNDFAAFEAKIEVDRRGAENGNSMTAENFFSFEDLQNRLAQGVHLALPTEKLEDLRGVLEKHPGDLRVTLYHPDVASDRYTKAPLNEAFNVSGSPECLRELSALVGTDCLAVSFHKEIAFEQRMRPQRRRAP